MTSNVDHAYKCFFEDCNVIFESSSEAADHVKKRHCGQTLCPYENCGIRLNSSNFTVHVQSQHCGRINQVIPKSEEKCAEVKILSDCESLKLTEIEQTNFESKLVTNKLKLKSNSENFVKNLGETKNVNEDAKNIKQRDNDQNKSPTSDNLHKYLDSNSDSNSDSSDATEKKHCTSHNNDENETFQCSFEGCNKVFADKRKRNQHLRNIHKATVVKCPYEGCDKVFKHRNLSQHIDRIHKNVRVQCPTCEKGISKHCISKHKKICKGKDCLRNQSDSRVKCPYEGCDKIMKKKSLNVHIDCIHKKIMERCTICDKLLSKSGISQHYKICNIKREKNIPCTRVGCNKVFATDKYRREHERNVHVDDSSIKCPRIGCNIFVRPRNLKRHLDNMHDKL